MGHVVVALPQGLPRASKALWVLLHLRVPQGSPLLLVASKSHVFWRDKYFFPSLEISVDTQR